jgi:CheY-like chemotaxis protein
VQIEQLLLNLSTNARDAMPQGGEITVRTKRDAPDLPQPFGYLHFSDTGVGMDEEPIKRVFEPFFTTKEVGKGTGLGLSVVWSIAEQNGGRISVDSTVGRGTTFTIALPLIKTTSNASEAQTAGLAVGGSETILVVEDDDIVRDTARATLEGVGYTVIEAADGEAALAAFSSCRDTIALAVVDVVLPKGNGAQLLEDMRKTKPQMKALVMSAHDDRLHDAGAGGAATGLLRKPFMPLDLVARVREVLDG